MTRRVAAVFLCLAVIGAIDTAYPGSALAGLGASATLTYERGGSAPAELGVGRASARLLASARQQRLDRVHPAIASWGVVVARTGSSAGMPPAGALTLPSTPVRSRSERGPPPPFLS